MAINLVFIIAIVAFWAICAAVAAAVAPQGRRAEFATLTMLFLGPLGIAAASIAPERDHCLRIGDQSYARAALPANMSTTKTPAASAGDAPQSSAVSNKRLSPGSR